MSCIGGFVIVWIEWSHYGVEGGRSVQCLGRGVECFIVASFVFVT